MSPHRDRARPAALAALARTAELGAVLAALVAVLVGLGACFPSFAPLAECYADSDCPSGQSCLDHRCELADAGAPDAAPKDSGPTDAAARDAAPDAGPRDASAPDSGLLCPDGPYGTGLLYFGAPEPEPTWDGAKGTGTLSADALHFIKGQGGECPDCYYTIDYVRTALDAPWVENEFRVYFWADHLHLSGDALWLFGCHGGELKCGFHSRARATDAFQGDADLSFFELPGFDVHVDQGGAVDYALIPTPDGRVVAFASNRRSAAEDVRDLPATAESTDLWTATARDPASPRAGFDHLVRHPLASSAVARDFPEWIADDASMLVLVTRAPGANSLDLALTSSVAGAFGPAARIEILSDRREDEDGFSMPSLATLRAQGGRGVGYLRRTRFGDTPSYLRFPVCLGAPGP